MGVDNYEYSYNGIQASREQSTAKTYWSGVIRSFIGELTTLIVD